MKVWLSRSGGRLAVLTLTLVLVLALAACGAQTDAPAATATPAVETPAVATPAPTAAAQSGQTGSAGAAEGAQALTAVLADVEKNVQVGVAGSTLKAVPYAVKLLDWGAASTMTQSEIKSAVAAWLSDQGNDAQVAFSRQMDLIDTTCQTLMSSNARSLLDESGCRDVKGDWPGQVSDRVEAVLEAVGLRG